MVNVASHNSANELQGVIDQTIFIIFLLRVVISVGSRYVMSTSGRMQEIANPEYRKLKVQTRSRAREVISRYNNPARAELLLCAQRGRATGAVSAAGFLPRWLQTGTCREKRVFRRERHKPLPNTKNTDP